MVVINTPMYHRAERSETENCFEKHLSSEIRCPGQKDYHLSNKQCILWSLSKPKINVPAKHAINKMLKMICGYESTQKHPFLALRLFEENFEGPRITTLVLQEPLSASDSRVITFLQLQIP